MDPRQVGKTALGEGPDQVERRRGLVVAPRPGAGDRAAGASSLNATSLTMWPRNEGSATPSTISVFDRAGLGELAGDAADLHHGHARRVGEHHRHLEDDPQLLPDRVGAKVPKDSAQSPAWSRNALPVGNVGQVARQVAGLTGEDQRRPLGERLRRPSNSASSGHSGCCSGGSVAPRGRVSTP